MNEQIDHEQMKDPAHVEAPSMPESATSEKALIGCSTGDHHFDIPMVVLSPTLLKHSHGLSGIKDAFTGMSTPLSVVTVYRPQQ